MHIKTFLAVYPDTSVIDNIDDFTDNVRNSFQDEDMERKLKRSEVPHFVLYNIEGKALSSKGLICLTNIQDYRDGNILRHEKTLEEKELEQIKLISVRKSMVKPVLLAYPSHEVFDDYLETLKTDNNLVQHFHFDDKDEKHTFWTVSDPKSIEHITTFFENELKRVYIADGHHRLSTFSRYGNESGSEIGDYVLSVYIPFSGLQIHPFNRIINLSENWDWDLMMKKLKGYCFVEKIKKPFSPKFKFNFLMTSGSNIYSCVWKPSLLEKYKDEPLVLDTALINAVLFKDLFEMKDVRTDDRIKYVEGYKGWEGFYKSFKKAGNNVGFYLYPIDFEDFQKVSDLGLTLPPKSTWFEPRIRNGLVIHDLRLS